MLNPENVIPVDLDHSLLEGSASKGACCESPKLSEAWETVVDYPAVRDDEEGQDDGVDASMAPSSVRSGASLDSSRRARNRGVTEG